MSDDILGTVLGDNPHASTAPKPVNVGAAPAFFSCWDMHSYYGESYIVQGVSMDIHEGEIVALLGRNGAGKTTTLRSIARMDDPQLKQGEIWLDHQPLHTMESWQASRNGVGLVPEDRAIIAGLTVEENLTLSQIAPPMGWSLERIYDHFPRLAERRNQEGITLSGGEQQMLAIGRALMARPRMIMMDEPSMGLAPQIVEEIFEIVKDLNTREGVSFLLAEQNTNVALRYAKYGYILESGRVVMAGDAESLRSNEDVKEFYLGISTGGRKSCRDVKHYRRRKRGLG